MKIIFVGDIYLKYNKLDITPSINFDNYDLRIANFEAPIKENILSKKNPKIGPNLCQSIDSLKTVVENNFNIINLSNNHSMDYGIKSAIFTKKQFELYKCKVIGIGNNLEEAISPLIYIDPITKEKIAFISLCEAQFGTILTEKDSGVGWICHPTADNVIKKACTENDKVIILTHAGLENTIDPLPEWQDVYRRFIDMGAYAVIASHPHVPQGVEIYKGQRIYYSLGNFAFDSISDKPERFSNRSVIVSLDTATGNYSEIFVTYNNGIVNLSSSQKFRNYFIERSNIIKNRSLLENKANFISNLYWEKIYKNYYKSIYKTRKFSIKKRIALFIVKKFIKTIQVKESSFSELWLYHNLVIESHRFIVLRYLRNNISNIISRNK